MAKNYQYFIIGGGTTAAAAVDGICEVDSTGGIGRISVELDGPHGRPPLSAAGISMKENSLLKPEHSG